MFALHDHSVGPWMVAPVVRAVEAASKHDGVAQPRVLQPAFPAWNALFPAAWEALFRIAGSMKGAPSAATFAALNAAEPQ